MLARYEALEKLAQLHRDGVISDDEFARERTKLLSPGIVDKVRDYDFGPLRVGEKAKKIGSEAAVVGQSLLYLGLALFFILLVAKYLF